MQSGVSHGFNTEAVRSLAELHIEHGFLTHDEADAFLSDIPVPGEHDEPQSNVADYMTCSESQSRAFKWVESQLAAGKQIRAAINWTCWNWKILSSSWPNWTVESKATGCNEVGSKCIALKSHALGVSLTPQS